MHVLQTFATMSSTAASTAFCASPAGSSGSDPAIAKLLCSMRQIQEELQVGVPRARVQVVDHLAVVSSCLDHAGGGESS